MKKFTNFKMRKSVVGAFVLGISIISNGYAQWTDDFESYTTNSWPTTWVADANATDISTNYVDNTVAYQGTKSLHIFGSIGGCWAAIAYHPVALNSPYEVELAVRNGSESLSGCNPDRAGLALRQGTSWTNPSRRFVSFKGDGTLLSGGGGVSLGTYTTLTWYTVKVRYERPSPSTVKLSYWINGIYKGNETLPTISAEDLLTNLEVTAWEGTAWFDDVTINEYIAPNMNVSPSSLTICWASGCDGNFNISSNVSWTVTDNQSWLSVSPSNGSDSGIITVVAAIDNPTSSDRTATVTVSGSGVSDQTVIITQEGKPSSINENELSKSVIIHPNPSNGEFIIEMKITEPQDFEFKLFNVAGQQIYREFFGTVSGVFRKTIDISNFAKGIYTVQLITDKGTVNKQVIVH